MSPYAFDNSAVVQTADRFASLEHCYDPVTFERLNALGVGPGWNCLEVGAGSGSVAAWLADRVGRTGAVVATDIDTRLMGQLPDNVEVRTHDIARDEVPEAAFDLVHARLVLLHLPERHRALRQIWNALRPGGVLVLDEFDCTWLPVLAAPDRRSGDLFGRVIDGIHELLRRNGADVAWGRNAYAALAEAGFVDQLGTMS